MFNSSWLRREAFDIENRADFFYRTERR